MPNSVQPYPDEVVPKATKKEKRTKKDKKEKSTPKLKADYAKQDLDDESQPASKKRKREALPDEIEIDVNLPEPPSKKEARKAKKTKTTPTSSTNGAELSTSKAEQQDEDKKAGKRSQYGVWIGNLPWSATKDTLRKWIVESAEIQDGEITRVHMPAPKKPAPPHFRNKPMNQGFAYVDFATELAMYSGIALTEQKMDGRALLIKNAKNFEGRPDKPKTEEDTDMATKTAKEAKKPNKRVFVGNLAFDVTKDDLLAHFGQCGPMADVHMATFEDTGKCKGYAWVTFEDVDAATSAVRGYVFKEEAKKKDDDSSDDANVPQKKAKKRKWLLNKLLGRDLRCEFAEDSTTRYIKRFGKDKKDNEDWASEENPAKRERPQQRKSQWQPRKVDPRTIRSGAAHMNSARASQAIVEGKGTKITFD